MKEKRENRKLIFNDNAPKREFFSYGDGYTKLKTYICDNMPNLEVFDEKNLNYQSALTKGEYTIFDHYSFLLNKRKIFLSCFSATFSDLLREKVYKDTIFRFKEEILFNVFDFTSLSDGIHKIDILILKDFNSIKIYNEKIELFGDKDFIEKHKDFILKLQKKYRKKMIPKKDSIFFLVEKGNQLTLQPFDLPVLEIDLSKQYNNDFIDISNSIIENINSDKNGLVLLHGEAGCGKTSYVQYLTGHIKRKIVFIPPSMFQVLQSPKFLDFLYENRGCTLIIEDSEGLLRSREFGNANDCSFLLNLTDGFVSKILNMQVICSFNCELKEIDQALLRKGRLLNAYEFKKLSKDKAINLLHELKYDFNENEIKDMTLAEIYNFEQENNNESLKNERVRIGF